MKTHLTPQRVARAALIACAIHAGPVLATSFVVQYVPPAPARPAAGALPPGLYVSVIDGAINLSNRGGTQNFSAGQFGYTPSGQQPPVMLPANPGMQFTPPPAFSAAAPPSGSAPVVPGQSNTVDCEVR